VVEQVVEEITDRGLTSVLLWGHSSGAAFAVETARKLRERGVEVLRVFLAAQLLGTVADRRAAIASLSVQDSAEVAAGLVAAGGYADLGELDAQRAEHVGAAFRHDCVSAHRYFVEALDGPTQERLSAPVSVVVTSDDPATAGYQKRYLEWEQLAEHVDLCELAPGGHYFLRTRPDDVARVVLQAAQVLASSPSSN
jgi:surfactin synthase thioesterase subunit